PAERPGGAPDHAAGGPRGAVRGRGVPGRRADHQEPNGGQDRPAAVLPADRHGPVAPLPLGVRDLLHRDGAVELPVPDLRAEAAGGGVPPTPRSRPAPATRRCGRGRRPGRTTPPPSGSPGSGRRGTSPPAGTPPPGGRGRPPP